MALTTRIDEAEAARVLADYGLELERLEALPAAGTVNSNYAVRASGARWFLRINEGKSDEDARSEAELVARLRERGVPTPAPLPTRAGALFARAAGKPVTLFPWVAGREAHGDGDAGAAALVGSALGRLHAA